MEGAMDAIVAKREGGSSIADLGFRDVGLDDGWQACGQGVHGGFHDAGGRPVVNTTSFPDLRAMTRYGHSKGLTVGWYANNCNCREEFYNDQRDVAAHYAGDVAAIVGYGFDGVKLDGCGQFTDLGLWSMLFQISGRNVSIENCHWGGETPYFAPDSGEFVCPYNFYRCSGDIWASFDSVMSNLQEMVPFLQLGAPLSRPGCWAYPDMLQVGHLASYEEDRAHFSAWAITSSPLILSFDVADESLTTRVWPIISNEEVLRVNQLWAGHPGTLAHSEVVGGVRTYVFALPCDASDVSQRGWHWEATDGGNSLVSRNGLCVDTSQRRPLLLMPCDPSSPNQTFRVGANGTLEQAGPAGRCCVDIFRKVGPSVQCTACGGADALNERFTLFQDMWRDAGSTVRGNAGPSSDPPYPARCMAARNAPLGLGAQKVTSILWQVWAKPLPESRVAVLVLNRAQEDLVATLQFADLPFAVAASAHVRDLYARKDLGSFEHTFTTDRIAVRDSRLLLLAPAPPLPQVEYT